MSGLRESLGEYLAVRRALGYKLERTERLLCQFLDYLDAAGADRITVEHAVAWATLPGPGEHWHAMRLGAGRGFARCGASVTSHAAGEAGNGRVVELGPHLRRTARAGKTGPDPEVALAA